MIIPIPLHVHVFLTIQIFLSRLLHVHSNMKENVFKSSEKE